MDILRGRNLLTTLDTPPVMPNRDTGRKSRFFHFRGPRRNIANKKVWYGKTRIMVYQMAEEV